MKIQQAPTLAGDLVVSIGLSTAKNGSVRRDVGDIGQMFGLGYKSMAHGEVYRPTNDRRTGQAMNVLCSLTQSWMLHHFKDEFNEIMMDTKRYTEKFDVPYLEEMGGPDGLGSSIMFSKNLGNSSHYDYRDRTRSVSIWAERFPGTASNWFFVLPNISVDGSKGVLIRLQHGTVISWDG